MLPESGARLRYPLGEAMASGSPGSLEKLLGPVSVDGFEGSKDKRELTGSNLDLDSGVVFPMTLDLVDLDCAVIKHDKKIGTVIGIISQTKIDRLETIPENLAGTAPEIEMTLISGFGLVLSVGPNTAFGRNIET
jgi:hypothetical protein